MSTIRTMSVARHGDGGTSDPVRAVLARRGRFTGLTRQLLVGAGWAGIIYAREGHVAGLTASGTLVLFFGFACLVSLPYHIEVDSQGITVRTALFVRRRYAAEEVGSLSFVRIAFPGAVTPFLIVNDLRGEPVSLLPVYGIPISALHHLDYLTPPPDEPWPVVEASALHRAHPHVMPLWKVWRGTVVVGGFVLFVGVIPVILVAFGVFH